MKISEYPQITKFTEDNILLVDGNGGTKKILYRCKSSHSIVN